MIIENEDYLYSNRDIIEIFVVSCYLKTLRSSGLDRKSNFLEKKLLEATLMLDISLDVTARIKYLVHN